MAQAPTMSDAYLSDFYALEREGPKWLRELRAEAMTRFRELGFPTARRGNEKWKYTNVGPIADAEFAYEFDAATAVKPSDLRRLVPWDDGWTTAVFVDGRYSPALSSPAAGDVRVVSLAEAVETHGAQTGGRLPELVRGHLARHAAFADDGFVALNTAFLRDGAFVHLPDGVAANAPLHLLFLASRDGAVAYPRTLVVAGAGSRLSVIESYVGLASGRYFTNAVTEIVLGEGAQVEHHKLLLESEEAFHVATGRVYQAGDSSFTSTFCARGAAIARNDVTALLDAPGGSCTLNGLYMTGGSQHIDNYLNIDHAKPHTTSRLLYRGILAGESRAIFGGTVLVRPGADKTDAHQEDKNLILSEKAEVVSKPSLEIYADDVICGHGATAGAFADDAIFYMRSRGLDLETASAFLVKGFASGVLDRVRIEPLRAYLEKLVARTLRGVRVAVPA